MVNWCYRCNGSGSIKDFSAKWWQFRKRIPGPICNGKGVIIPGSFYPEMPIKQPARPESIPNIFRSLPPPGPSCRTFRDIIFVGLVETKESKQTTRNYEIYMKDYRTKGEIKMARNYFQIEKTEDGIFIAEGKGTPAPENYDEETNWNEWEEVKDEKALFTRIKELLNKT